MVKPIIEILRAFIKQTNVQGVILKRNSLIGDNGDVPLDTTETVHVTKSIKRSFRLLYYIMKIRGYKTIVKFLTHEVSDLEPTFYFLVSLNPKDYDAWEMRYVLLIWLSLICMIPFDLQTVDSRAVAGSDKMPLVDHMIDLSKFYLNSTGKERDGAIVLLSRLLTRRDIAAVYLTDYVEWATNMAHQKLSVFTTIGILNSLCAIYKLGQRSTLLPTVSTAWSCLSLIEENQNLASVRKSLVKLAQRFGLCYLRPKVAAWRYQRGNRSLRENLAGTSNTRAIDPSNVSQTISNSTDSDVAQAQQEEEEIPEQIEEIIEILLNGLRDKDTVIRWSSAKGIGRLTHRLPQDLADDVIGSLLELFSENTFSRDGVTDISAVYDNTWHGTCLAVAELARRGLLLPKRLDETIPWISKALKFDLKRGSYSIGSHVRDAACYVCWSFARAYASEVLAPHATELANSLVVVSVFDREVNVRRASSAAFQENVGRQGIFPHGIDIITAADYFTVGNRTNAFLEISVKIAAFPEYRTHLIDHLCTVTISNWDKRMRELCAQALNRLTKLDVEYMVTKMLPYLIPQTKSKDFQILHGALMAIGEISLAWSQSQNEDRSWIERHNDLVTEIANIILGVHGDLFVDFGSELSCQAAAHYVACLSKSGWPVDEYILHDWKNIVYDLLGRKDEYGQQIAVRAVEAMVAQYGIKDKEIESYINRANPAKNRYRRRGFALALGVLDFPRIPNWLERVVDALILASAIQEIKPWNDAETRRNAIISLANIPQNLGDKFKTFATHKVFEKLVSAFFTGLEDYSVDSRGDVGSWVREACMVAFGKFVPFIVRLDEQGASAANENNKWWTDELSSRVISSLLKQSVERIDRLRTCAGETLINLLYEKKSTAISGGGSDEWLLSVPGREVLQTVFPIDEEIQWTSPSELYPRMVKLLVLPEYRFQLFTGLILAAGGITESLIRYSSSALIEYANNLPISVPTQEQPLTFVDLATTLLQVYRTYECQDRLMLPTLEVTDMLFETGVFQKFAEVYGEKQSDEFSLRELLDRTRKECVRSRDVRKISAGVRIFCGFVSLGEPYRKKALFQLLSFLIHSFPKVRRLTADQLYLTLITESVDEDVDDDEAMQESEESSKKTQIEDILTTTDWDDEIPKLKGIRSQLYPLLGVLPPK